VDSRVLDAAVQSAILSVGPFAIDEQANVLFDSDLLIGNGLDEFTKGR
jgi:hypothetical protein